MKLFKLIIYLRSGRKYKSDWIDYKNLDDVVEYFNNIKTLTRFSVNSSNFPKEIAFFNPEDISYVRVLRSKNWISKLIINLLY